MSYLAIREVAQKIAMCKFFKTCDEYNEKLEEIIRRHSNFVKKVKKYLEEECGLKCQSEVNLEFRNYRGRADLLCVDVDRYKWFVVECKTSGLNNIKLFHLFQLSLYARSILDGKIDFSKFDFLDKNFLEKSRNPENLIAYLAFKDKRARLGFVLIKVDYNTIYVLSEKVNQLSVEADKFRFVGPYCPYCCSDCPLRGDSF